MHAEQHAVATGRLTEPVDLLAQRQQLLTGLFEGLHQLGVPGGERVDPRLELVHITGAAETALRADRVLQLLAQYAPLRGAAPPALRHRRWTSGVP